MDNSNILQNIILVGDLESKKNERMLQKDMNMDGSLKFNVEQALESASEVQSSLASECQHRQFKQNFEKY